jgi:SagB-type dehydrogenase family enzyme
VSRSAGISIGDTVALPPPQSAGAGSLEAALRSRRSVREFGRQALPLEVVSQLLWSAQGITSARGGRTAPSAGGLYPLEIDLVSGSVTDLPIGVYRYRAADHTLRLRQGGDLREPLRDVALQQHAIAAAAAVIVIVAVPARSESKYAGRAERYIHMEVGHVAQNVCLQVAALDIGTVVIGAFEDAGVSEVLGLGTGEAPVALLPVGYPA